MDLITCITAFACTVTMATVMLCMAAEAERHRRKK